MKLINLLPKPRQQELRYEAVVHSLWTVLVFSLVSFALVFLSQFGAKFYLEAQASSLNGRINQLKSQVNKQENADVKKQINSINDVISDYKNLATAAPKWSRVLKAFASLPPDGVKINTFSIDTSRKSVAINGFSPTREAVIQLYNNILQDKKDFLNVDYPLENVAKPVDVPFHFTFYIQPDLIK